MNSDFRNHLESVLGKPISSETPLKPGMDAEVFQVSADGQDYVVKIGDNVLNDIPALEYVETHDLRLPVPRIVGRSSWNNIPFIIMTKCPGVMLAEISSDYYDQILPNLIRAQHELHQIHRNQAGNVQNPSESWTDYLSHQFSGDHPWFPWSDIVIRPGIDPLVIESARSQILYELQHQSLPEDSFSFLHTDFNQTNLLVDPNTLDLTGIIDWSEAIFRDPLYDLARIHLLIIHFELGPTGEQAFFDQLNLSPQELQRENLYLHIIILTYISWYSEEDSDFCRSRLALHQELLRQWLV